MTTCSGFYLTATPHSVREPLWFSGHLGMVIGISIGLSLFPLCFPFLYLLLSPLLTSFPCVRKGFILVIVFITIGIFSYRQQKRLEQKYGFQEVDRLLINNISDDECDDDELDFPPPRSLFLSFFFCPTLPHPPPQNTALYRPI